MVKNMEKMFEVNSEAFTMAPSIQAYPTAEVLEIFKKPDVRTLVIVSFLHIADISNSMKPFRICRIWAWKVLDEFFNQGDEEKRLGIPVQALNDRDKVNKPFSQIGLIEFLATPLV